MKSIEFQSWVYAALEVLPGEARDLSYLLEAGSAEPIKLVTGEFAAPGYDGALNQHISRELDRGRLEHWYKKLDRYLDSNSRAKIITVLDAEYPANLAACFDRPPALTILGQYEPDDARSVALVGGREASPAGIEAARALAAAAAQSNICVVSGLARGIDAAAHRGALDAGGRTLAVLGSGADTITPEENIDLAEAVQRKGALISQFALGAPPTRSTFPLRNAVIAGLAQVSVVVEARPKSGSINQISHAIRLGRAVGLYRPLMAGVPGTEELVELDNVHYVDSPDDIRQLVDGADTGGACA